MILLLDIGNTRIKWAELEDGRLGAQAAAAHTEERAQAFERIFAEDATSQHGPIRVPSRVVVSNVGGEEVARLCSQACTRRFGLVPEFLVANAKAGGVINAYAEPAKLGVDRWLAMIAGYDIAHAAICVVSVGTALTIDVVDEAGNHLGGIIAPGLNLMRDSLLRNTSEIGPRMGQDRVGDSLFATHTQAAVINGCRYALAALIDKAYRSAYERLQITPRLLITGGGAAGLVPLIESASETVDDLVLRGMAVVLGSNSASH